MIKITTVFLAAIIFFTAGSTLYALYSVSHEGLWPKSWPRDLEPLRKQSRTLMGPILPRRHYEIPFTNREDFEAAWPHLLKVKSQGAPVILVRAPDAKLGISLDAGVRIHTPPPQKGGKLMPEKPLPGDGSVWQRWMYTNFIVLVVDGKIVDLNRIPLPDETPIIDERFKD